MGAEISGKTLKNDWLLWKIFLVCAVAFCSLGFVGLVLNFNTIKDEELPFVAGWLALYFTLIALLVLAFGFKRSVSGIKAFIGYFTLERVSGFLTGTFMVALVLIGIAIAIAIISNIKIAWIPFPLYMAMKRML